MNRRRKPPRAAVALEYDGEGAPRVTAKGRGAVAEEIIAVAEANGIPLQEDTALMELLSQLDLDAEIPEALYRAVAEVLAFAYIVTGRFTSGWREGGDGSTEQGRGGEGGKKREPPA